MKTKTTTFSILKSAFLMLKQNAFLITCVTVPVFLSHLLFFRKTIYDTNYIGMLFIALAFLLPSLAYTGQRLVRKMLPEQYVPQSFWRAFRRSSAFILKLALILGFSLTLQELLKYLPCFYQAGLTQPDWVTSSDYSFFTLGWEGLRHDFGTLEFSSLLVAQNLISLLIAFVYVRINMAWISCFTKNPSTFVEGYRMTKNHVGLIFKSTLSVALLIIALGLALHPLYQSILDMPEEEITSPLESTTQNEIRHAFKDGSVLVEAWTHKEKGEKSTFHYEHRYTTQDGKTLVEQWTEKERIQGTQDAVADKKTTIHLSNASPSEKVHDLKKKNASHEKQFFLSMLEALFETFSVILMILVQIALYQRPKSK